MFEDNLKRILFVGGDLRQIRTINELSKKGYEVSVFGFDAETVPQFCEKIQWINDFSEVSDVYGVVVLPLPYTTDGKNINAPFCRYPISIAEVFANISAKSKVLAGRCDAKIKFMAESHRIMLVDYLCREELAMLNAIPTAEGAIQIAMEETPFTLHSSKCLVVGNGRIGKILSKMLHGLGAEVTVAARKKADMAFCFAMGYKTIPISTLGKNVEDFEIIFNTAPSLIFDFGLLAQLKKDVLVIDLASKPGGVDFDEARRLGIKVIWALSLPGKVAANTAGDIVCNTIINIIDEMEADE